MAEAHAVIDRGLAEFQTRHPKEEAHPKPEQEEDNETSKETVGEPTTESPVAPAVIDTTNPPKQARKVEAKTEKYALEEHNGEVVVENEEDTVIY